MTRRSDLMLEDIEGCDHQPETAVSMRGEVIHWLCRCGHKHPGASDLGAERLAAERAAAESRAEKAERERDALSSVVGAALVCASLCPGESPAFQVPEHAIIEAVDALRAERDAALAKLAEIESRVIERIRFVQSQRRRFGNSVEVIDAIESCLGDLYPLEEGSGGSICGKCGAPIGYCRNGCARDAERASTKLADVEARATAAERERDEAVGRSRQEANEALHSAKRLADERDALFRDFQIEGDESLRDVCERLSNAATTRTRELEACRGKLAANAASDEKWDREAVVLAQRAESIAHDHAKAIAERDEALAKLDGAYFTIDGMETDRLRAINERDAALAKLALTERVVEAARAWRTAELAALRATTSSSWPALRKTELVLLAALRDALDAKDSELTEGVAASVMGGHEVPAPNRQPVEPPSDPATGTTRREPSESARCGASKGAVACRGCGQPLATPSPDLLLADGCPCNSRRGVNHGLVPVRVCTCAECDPAQTGAARPEPGPYGHVSKADECQVDEPCPECGNAKCHYPDHGNGPTNEPLTRADVEEMIAALREEIAEACERAHGAWDGRTGGGLIARMIAGELRKGSAK